MKKITAYLGILGVVSMISACSSDSTSALQPEQHAVTSSASTIKPASSATVATPTSSVASNDPSSPDTTILHDTIRVERPHGDYEDPYFSSGIFCWSAECEANWNSSDSKSSSSAATIEINMSSSEPTPPLISGNQMIDQRDQKSYSIANLANKMWMTTNLNFKTNTGYYCKTESDSDMCETYGGYYTYAGALRACPDGWRLPTEDEITALYEVVDIEWWTLGGRFKFNSEDETSGTYGLEKQQGYWWVSGGASFRVQPDTEAHELQGSVSLRAYNVRCVQN